VCIRHIWCTMRPIALCSHQRSRLIGASHVSKATLESHRTVRYPPKKKSDQKKKSGQSIDPWSLQTIPIWHQTVRYTHRRKTICALQMMPISTEPPTSRHTDLPTNIETDVVQLIPILMGLVPTMSVPTEPTGWPNRRVLELRRSIWPPARPH
jgi:hypothetical protein